MSGFSEVLALHKVLDEMFMNHQRALLIQDWNVAELGLKNYETLLRAHMQDEEEILLPVYDERVKIERGGETVHFLNEHRKMLEFLAHFREQLPRLSHAPDPQLALLKLLDQESSFKRLVEHHDEREERYLYPALERVTSENEKLTLLEQLCLSGKPVIGELLLTSNKTP